MPAKSEKQRVAAAIAYSVKKGKTPKKKLKGASRSMAKGMSIGELRKYAKKGGR